MIKSVDETNPARKPVEVGSLSQYLHGFLTSEVVIAGFLPSTVCLHLSLCLDLLVWML